MKIDKAIETLTTHTHAPGIDQFPDLKDAVKLGIEALKHIKASRPTGLHPGMYRLPGETEE